MTGVPGVIKLLVMVVAARDFLSVDETFNRHRGRDLVHAILTRGHTAVR